MISVPWNTSARETGAGSDPGLMDVRPVSVVKPLLIAAQVHAALGQRYALHGEQFGVDAREQIKVLLNRSREGIDLVGRRPFDL